MGLTRRQSLVLVAASLAGVAIRAALVPAAPRHAFLADHLDFVVWSEWAYRHGPASLYDLPARRLINAELPASASTAPAVAPLPNFNEFNYPPLAAYAFWFQGWLRNALPQRIETHPVHPDVAQFAGIEPGDLTSPVVNTVTTRAIGALLPSVADFLMAWGVLRLVRALRPGAAHCWPAVSAYAVTVLAPPVFLDSAFWTQMDALPACLLVWSLYLLITGRYAAAGACFGAALMTKTLAVLFLPTLALAALALLLDTGRRRAAAAGLARAAAAALVVTALAAAPAAVANAGHPEGGWLRWYRRAVVNPIRERYPITTLKAFNFWWLDFLLARQSPAVLYSDVPAWAGLSKDRVGQILLAAALVAAAGACVWRWRGRPQAWAGFAFLSLLAAFAWPTRVHERYIYYCLPFLIACAAVYPPWRVLVGTVLAVGTLELTWYLWLSPESGPANAPPDTPAAAIVSLVLAVVSVASFLYGVAVLFAGRRAGAPTTPAVARPGPER